MLDPFLTADGQPRTVRGITLAANAPRIAELAGRIGFDTVWIDLEHGTASFSEVDTLCLAIEAGGAIPTVRIPDHERHHILRTLESGARIVIVPMIDDAAAAREIVRHGKYPPLGERGFYSKSRGTDYGLDPLVETFERANQRTHFFAQIETLKARENVEEICSVESLAGIFVGPGDLSTSLGKPAAFGDPEVIGAVAEIIRKARAALKHAGILAAPGPLLDAALEADADLIFVGNDIADLATSWRRLIEGL